MVIRSLTPIILIITLSSCSLLPKNEKIVEVPIFVDRELSEELQTEFKIDQKPEFSQNDDLVCLDEENRDKLTQMIQDMMFRIRLWEAEMGTGD